MINKKKTVFVLGSGFSKSFSERIPTMKDLTERLFELKADGDFQNLSRIVNKLYRQSSCLSDFRNMENIATLIFSKAIFKDYEERMDYEKLKFELIKFIYKEIQHPKLERGREHILLNFIQTLSAKEEDANRAFNTLLTFNYDLIIEDLLKKYAKESGDIEINYGLKFERYEHYNPKRLMRDLKRLTYIKLHGSFNWFRAKGSDSNDIRNIYLLDEESDMYGIHERDIPTYIPMADVKALFLNGTLYSTLWAKAIEYLNHCDEIILIGYGFPKTDLNNLALFLDYKDKIKAINVLEEEDSRKLKRLYQLFGEEKVYNKEATSFIQENILKEIEA